MVVVYAHEVLENGLKGEGGENQRNMNKLREISYRSTFFMRGILILQTYFLIDLYFTWYFPTERE